MQKENTLCGQGASARTNLIPSQQNAIANSIQGRHRKNIAFVSFIASPPLNYNLINLLKNDIAK